MKILIVEDEILLADSLRDMLQQKGFQVEVAYDGITGKNYAELGIYDLLILDVMMPGLNGLELARADNGKIKTFFQPISLSNVVTQAALPFEPLFYERRLQLQTIIAPDIQLTGSGQHLQQVVEILLDNAYKYSDSGIVCLSLSQQGRYALLSVSNPGNPIPAEDHQKIFQRFYRADEARAGSGSFGLGLAIAKAIVTDHNGKIWVHSNDSGNCFYVQLPL
jgi:signal transduction histidine kinase